MDLHLELVAVAVEEVAVEVEPVRLWKDPRRTTQASSIHSIAPPRL